MGQNVLAGSALVATTAPGGVDQYYGLSDASLITVTSTTLTALSSTYTINANEPYAGAQYQLACGGYGTQGSTQQILGFMATLNGTNFFTNGWCDMAAAVVGTSAEFGWSAVWDFQCVDGVQNWVGTLAVKIGTNATPAGGASPTATPTSAVVAAVSSPIACVLEANWGSVTGAPTISKTWGTFRKVA